MKICLDFTVIPKQTIMPKQKMTRKLKEKDSKAEGDVEAKNKETDYLSQKI